jgi:prefoldin subunit 1
LDPTFIKGYYRLASAQIELKDYDSATATIRQGLGIDANNTQLLKQNRTIKQLKKAAAVAKQAPKSSSQGAASRFDDAANRELQDLQVQYSQTNREFSTVQANIVKTQREHKMAELTKGELGDLPEESKCYRSVGKMFLRSSRSGVLEHLDEQMEDQTKRESDMTQKMDYLERRMKSQRQNIEELMVPSSSAE